MSSSFRALSDVMLGNGPPARTGELIPERYTDMAGHPVPVDFERLIDLGAAEKVPAREAKAKP